MEINISFTGFQADVPSCLKSIFIAMYTNHGFPADFCFVAANLLTQAYKVGSSRALISMFPGGSEDVISALEDAPHPQDPESKVLYSSDGLQWQGLIRTVFYEASRSLKNSEVHILFRFNYIFTKLLNFNFGSCMG
jgi:hypothetical protein